MKITYLAHSGFLVETTQRLFLFDYYKGEIPVLPADKPLYIFASHRHGDHFVPEIFRIETECDTVRYLLAFDIRLTPRNLQRWGVEDEKKERLFSLKAHECYRFEDEGCSEMTVETFRSTDEGVAFLITENGRTIYHAGDLNWWLWEEEGPAWNGNMTANFKREIAKMEGRHIDLAFLPLDDRQGPDFYKGMDWYLRSCRIDYAFPMHYWEDASVIRRFEELECRKDYETKIMDTSAERIWIIE